MRGYSNFEKAVVPHPTEKLTSGVLGMWGDHPQNGCKKSLKSEIEPQRMQSYRGPPPPQVLKERRGGRVEVGEKVGCVGSVWVGWGRLGGSVDRRMRRLSLLKYCQVTWEIEVASLFEHDGHCSIRFWISMFVLNMWV